MELEKLKEKSSEGAQKKLQQELKKSYDVLKHLKSKLGNGILEDEYRKCMEEIQVALGLHGESLELTQDM